MGLCAWKRRGFRAETLSDGHAAPHRTARLLVTLCILGVLLASVCIYAFVQRDRIEEGTGVDVVVGSALMARLPLPESGECIPVLDALEEVSVRPTSQQTLIFRGSDFALERTAEEALDLCFGAQGEALVLLDSSGQTLGTVTSIYLPTDETAVKTFE